MNFVILLQNNFVSFFPGHLTTRSDVYSFGVVLLEMLSGRRAIDKNRPTGEHNLVEWAKPYLSNKRRSFRVIDARLQGQYSLSRAQRAAALAFQCLSAEPKFRPTMEEVVRTLEQLQESKNMAKSADKKEHRVQSTSASQNHPKGLPASMKNNTRAAPAPAPANVAYPRPSASPLFA